MQLYKTCPLVHDLWKNIIITFTAFHRDFFNYLDMISTTKRNYVDDSLKVRTLTL